MRGRRKHATTTTTTTAAAGTEQLMGRYLEGVGRNTVNLVLVVVVVVKLRLKIVDTLEDCVLGNNSSSKEDGKGHGKIWKARKRRHDWIVEIQGL